MDLNIVNPWIDKLLPILTLFLGTVAKLQKTETMTSTFFIESLFYRVLAVEISLTAVDPNLLMLSFVVVVIYTYML